MISQTLKQKLHEQKNEIGLAGGTINFQEYDEAKHGISAHISLKNWNIEILLQKDFTPVNDKRQKAYARKKKIQDGLETLLSDVLSHELAHWELPFGSERGCPYDTYNHDKIEEAVMQALPEDKKGHKSYVANAFEDLMINPRCREFNGQFSGQVLFWDNEGITSEQKGQQTYTAFYEAFVKLNMHLFGDNVDRALLKRHYSNQEKVDEAVKVVVNELSLPENIRDTSQLFNKQQWPRMAEIFARNLADLLEQSPTERLSAFSGKSGTGSEGKEAGNGIEQKSGTREGKEEIVYGRYASGDKQSPNFTSYEQLDSLYKKLARAIPVNVEAMTREQSLQIAPLTLRPFDEETDDPRKVKTSRVFVTDSGLQLAYQRHPLTVTAKSKIQRKSFPDFKLVVLDNSGSMKQALDGSTVGKTSFIPWGDNSKYHFALLGFYGIENFLQQQGVAQYINHGLSLFSSQTRYKETGFLKLDEVRKHALSPDWGSTNLDATVLSTALQGRDSFVLSISDGEIYNWDSEKSSFRKLAENNYFAHIQIGGKTQYTSDLESWKLPVFYVTSGKDLSKLMVDTAKDTYRRFTSQ
jgi:hypothetical protein